MGYDFSGYATKCDIRCTDGRTIKANAFKDNDGQKVPLVWQHKHDSPDNVLGHALLENRNDGVYCYCTFNDTDQGKTAKDLVKHGDITALSIYANHLKEQAGNVIHGAIREVSLVLTGANPGAFIDQQSIAHGDNEEYEAIIYNEDGSVEWGESNMDDEIYDILPEDMTEEELAHEEASFLAASFDDMDDEEYALCHYASPYYDPVYAHNYYMAHRQLKGERVGTLYDTKSRTDFKNDEKSIKKNRDSSTRSIKEQANAQLKSARESHLDDTKESYSKEMEELSGITDRYSADRANRKSSMDADEYKAWARSARKKQANEYASTMKAYSNGRKSANENYRKGRETTKHTADEANANARIKAEKDIEDAYTQRYKEGALRHPVKAGVEQGTKLVEKAKTYVSDKYDEAVYNTTGEHTSSHESKTDKLKKKVSGLLKHSGIDPDEGSVFDLMETLPEEDYLGFMYIVGAARDIVAHGDMDDIMTLEDILYDDENAEDILDIFDNMDPEIQDLALDFVDYALEGEDEDITLSHSDEDIGGTDDMRHNVFDNDGYTTGGCLSHSDMNDILAYAKKTGSLKDAMAAYDVDMNSLSHTAYGPYTSADGAGVAARISSNFASTGPGVTYGIAGVTNRNSDYGTNTTGYTEDSALLFPAAQWDKNIIIRRNNPTDWVAKVMGGVHKTPFSRIKCIYADIRDEDARAKGYIKGNQKVSEVISMFKRTTQPTTVYKMQKLDRDDIIDITDIDIVAWLKNEMRMMLEEEIARAIIVGDGRLYNDTDHINHDCIRPVMLDTTAELYTLNYDVAVNSNEYEECLEAIVKSKIHYEGTGTPTLFTTPEFVANCLLIKDSQGYRIYKSRQELCDAIGVSGIIEIPYMRNECKSNGDNGTYNTMFHQNTNTCTNPLGWKIAGTDANTPTTVQTVAILCNLADYTVGTDKGGAINMFDDFDIDFNKYTYLMETRCSGSLTKPHSAININVVRTGSDIPTFSN